jgi:hypothetical protein
MITAISITTPRRLALRCDIVDNRVPFFCDARRGKRRPAGIDPVLAGTSKTFRVRKMPMFAMSRVRTGTGDASWLRPEVRTGGPMESSE